jgi:Protein of unknown function (DUF3110)
MNKSSNQTQPGHLSPFFFSPHGLFLSLFFWSQPQAIMMDTLQSFCDKMGVHFQIVPDGVNVLPPLQNVKLVGRHNRSLRDQQNHLEYIFNMIDDDDDEPVEEGDDEISVSLSSDVFQ